MEQYLEFVANNTILIVALLASLFLVVFTEIRLSASGLSKVEPGQAVGLINQDAAISRAPGIFRWTSLTRSSTGSTARRR